MKIRWIILMVLLLASCGRDRYQFAGETPPREDEVVIRSRASLYVSTGTTSRRNAIQQNQPVTVQNSAKSRMTVDNSQFTVPTISNAVVDFGSLEIIDLLDNDLKVCGSGGNQKCGRALLRTYTTGAARAGLYNIPDDFGAPLTAFLTTPMAVGLEIAGAAVMQMITIPNTKKVIRHTDFSPPPNYGFQADFTDAGAGTYSTTIVIEYALAP